MTISLTTVAMNARLAGLRDLIDAGSGTAAILLLSGARPATGATYAGSILVRIDLPNPCGSVADGALTLTVGDWGNVLASGDIAWARIVSRDGIVIADLGVGLSGSGADIEINSLTVFAGGLIAITAAILRE